ncbi:MAG: hypothetical protein ACE5Q6_26925 [Dehalococcoidia bacterium]
MVSRGHPLADSARRAGTLSGLFNLPIRDKHEEGWIEATALFRNDDQRLRDLVADYGRSRWGSDNCHVAGSAFIIAYLTRVTWPVVAQYVLERRLPDVRLGNLVFHWNGLQIDGTALNRPIFAVVPTDPGSSHPDAVVVADEAEHYVRLKQWLFGSNLGIVIPSLRRAARASLKVSWYAVAASCAQAFRRLYEVAQEPETVVRAADTLFGDPSSPLYRQLTMEVFVHQGQQGFFSRRAGCCLWWRTEKSNDYCSNCILLAREQQDTRFRQILAGRP